MDLHCKVCSWRGVLPSLTTASTMWLFFTVHLHVILGPVVGAYVACSKSIRPLAGKNTFTCLEVCNLNPLQSSLLVTEHTSPSGSATVEAFLECLFVNGVQLGHHVLYNVVLWLKSSPFQLRIQVEEQPKIARNHVGRAGSLSNHRNVMFGQESLNQLRGMSWCVVMMQLPTGLVFCAAQHCEGNEGLPGSILC